MAHIVLAVVCASSPMTNSPNLKPMDSFKSGQPWLDTDGNVIDAHGAGILQHEQTFYWYGSRRTVNATGTQMDGGIALYSSSDLYAWKYESVVLRVFNCSDNNTDVAAPSTVGNYPAPSCTNGNGLDLERPKVVQCGGAKSGGKFVMWVRGTGYGNTPQLAGIATADSPKGPFTYVSNKTGSDDPFRPVAEGIKNYPAGYQYADATLFQDPVTSKTYVYWRSRTSHGADGSPTGFRAMELTSNCEGVVPGSDLRVTTTANREGPAMFYHGGLYYLYVSGTMGWSPTAMYVYAASTPLGNFSASSMDDHYWHAYSKGAGVYNSTAKWNGSWTVANGALLVGAPWGNASRDGNGGSDGVDISFGDAQSLCSKASKCAGFTFIDFDAAPAATKLLQVTFKSEVKLWPEKEVGMQPPPIPVPGQPGNTAPAQPGMWAYGSQSTYILPNPAYKTKQAALDNAAAAAAESPGAVAATSNTSSAAAPVNKVAPFVYMGDRWNYTNTFGTSRATYVWLPLFVDPEHPHSVKVIWNEDWKLDDESIYPF